jgi:putative heme iron utilization protein
MSENVRQEAETLLSNYASVHLSTLSGRQEPEASYAPCLLQNQRIYVLLSRLSSHTANLLDRPVASLMWIEDEATGANLFARRRLIARCQAMVIEKTDARYATLLDAMATRLGPTLSVLRSLPDFVLFELSPQEGRFIKGFGAAYRFEGFDLQGMTQVTAG